MIILYLHFVIKGLQFKKNYQGDVDIYQNIINNNISDYFIPNLCMKEANYFIKYYNNPSPYQFKYIFHLNISDRMCSMYMRYWCIDNRADLLDMGNLCKSVVVVSDNLD